MAALTTYLTSKLARRYLMGSVAESSKSGAKKVGSFFVAHWKIIIAVSVVVVAGVLIYKKGVKDGVDAADTAWINKYNETVDDFNKRLLALKGDSKQVGDAVDTATTGLDKDLDAEQARIDKLAADQAKQRAADEAAGKITCPNKIDLNGQLPDDFWKSWNTMNEAGARNNPYK